MALPKDMRLKGHRTFNYIHKNSTIYRGKLMTFKVARSNPEVLLTHKLSNATVKLSELLLILWDKRISGFDLATLKVINFP